jgi:biopolymer transport protein ExbD
VEAKPKANILVAISAQNEIWIDRKQVDKRGIKAAFERLLAENPEGSVVIQADKDAYTESVIEIANAARQADIVRVSISGKPGEQ